MCFSAHIYIGTASMKGIANLVDAMIEDVLKDIFPLGVPIWYIFLTA